MNIAGINIPTSVATTGSVIATYAAVFKIFADIDKNQSAKNRLFTSQFILGISEYVNGWKFLVHQFFEDTFGDSQFSFESLFKTISMSIIITLIALIFLGDADNYEVIKDFISGGSRLSAIRLADFIYLISGAFVAYINLVKTRFICNRFREIGLSYTILFIVIDFIASYTLYSIAENAFTILFYGYYRGNFCAIIFWMSANYVSILHALLPSEFSRFFAVIVMSALFTSAWWWTYLICIQILRLASSGSKFTQRLTNILPIKQHPVREIGRLVAVVWAMLVAVIGTTLS